MLIFYKKTKGACCQKKVLLNCKAFKYLVQAQFSGAKFDPKTHKKMYLKKFVERFVQLKFESFVF